MVTWGASWPSAGPVTPAGQRAHMEKPSWTYGPDSRGPQPRSDPGENRQLRATTKDNEQASGSRRFLAQQRVTGTPANQTVSQC